MARKSLLLQGPGGLLPFEVIVLLGLMILDSKAKPYLFKKRRAENEDAATVKEGMAEFFKDAFEVVEEDATGQAVSDLMENWNGMGKGAKVRLEDLIEWYEANHKMLDCLAGDLRAFLEAKYKDTEDPYSECDLKAADLLELLEDARLASWRRVDL